MNRPAIAFPITMVTGDLVFLWSECLSEVVHISLLVGLNSSYNDSPLINPRYLLRLRFERGAPSPFLLARSALFPVFLCSLGDTSLSRPHSRVIPSYTPSNNTFRPLKDGATPLPTPRLFQSIRTVWVVFSCFWLLTGNGCCWAFNRIDEMTTYLVTPLRKILPTLRFSYYDIVMYLPRLLPRLVEGVEEGEE
jgi:hypothetical protein